MDTAALPASNTVRLPVQVLLFIVTLGIYGLYWFYQTAVEMQDANDDHSGSPGLWLVLIFHPFRGVFLVLFLFRAVRKIFARQLQSLVVVGDLAYFFSCGLVYRSDRTEPSIDLALTRGASPEHMAAQRNAPPQHAARALNRILAST
jgi:hypothetical protein